MPRLDSLTSARWFAALYVFALHSTAHFAPGMGSASAASLGYSGVGFFFVLSGFVLAWSRADVPTEVFYWRRFARIYPLHLVTFLVAVLLLPAEVQGSNGLFPTVCGLLLVQAWVPMLHVMLAGNGASWSLSCEAFFYAVMPFLRPRPKPWRMVWLAIALTVVACVTLRLAAGTMYVDQVAFFNPAFRLGEFVAGVALGSAMRQGWQPRWSTRTAAVAAGVTMAALTGLNVFIVELPRDIVGLAAVLPFAALVCALATSDVAGRRSWLHHRGLVFFGECSFALYLVHGLVIRSMPFGGGLSRVGAALVVSMLLAVLAHRLVERPAEARLRRMKQIPPALTVSAEGGRVVRSATCDALSCRM